MINELKKILKTKYFYINMVALILVLLFFSLIYNSYHNIYDNNLEFGYGVKEYSTFEELKSDINEYRMDLDKLEISYKNSEISKDNYLNQKELLNQTIEVSVYLYDNHISYSDVSSLINVSSLTKEKVSFFRYIIKFAEIALTVSFLFFSIYVVNYEIDRGIYKFSYLGKKRTKILLNKLATYFICSAISFVIVVLLIFCYSMPLNKSIANLLVYYRDKIFIMSYNKYVWICFLSLFFNSMIWFFMFFALSLLFNRTLYLIIADVGVYIILQLLISFIPINLFKSFVQSPAFLFESTIPYNMFICTTILKVVAVAFFVINSAVYFKRKELG